MSEVTHEDYLRSIHEIEGVLSVTFSIGELLVFCPFFYMSSINSEIKKGIPN